MKPIIIQRIAVAALLLMAGLQTTQAQGIRVHYKNGSVTDVPAALFDRMVPQYPTNDNPTPGPGPDYPTDEPKVTVEPMSLTSGTALAFVSTLQQAGMPINVGLSVPQLNGTFSLKPTEVVKQWQAVPDEDDDIELDDTDEMVIKFSKLSGNNVWIDTYNVDSEGADYAIGSETDKTADGIKSFIMGNGNKFTAAFVYTVDWGSYLYYRFVYIFSGEVSGNNLKDLYVAVIGLDRNDEVTEYGIGRDGDGVSYATTWAPKPYSGDSRALARRMAARQKASTAEVAYSFTIYKTDGTSFSVTRDELDYVETCEASFDDRITQQIPQEYLGKMATYMPIYSGNTPPTVNGTYRLSVQTLVYDAGGSYSPGKTFVDNILDFSNQNTTKNIVDYQNKEVDNQGNIVSQSNKAEMVLMGEGQNFTAFVINEGTAAGIWYKQANVISGTMTADGIKNVYLGILMLDKGDDSASSKKLMNKGVFRVFYDSDGLASKTTWNARHLAPKAAGGEQLSIIAAGE